MSPSSAPEVAELLLNWEELYQLSTRLGSYLGCLRAADGHNEEIAREYAALQSLGAEQKKLDVLLLDLLKQADDESFELSSKKKR